ncbi:CFI-box-CTERM domain-containing protein [Acidobacteriota bacterium]
MKVKTLAIIFLLNFAFSLTLNAQWARTYGTDDDEHAYFVKQTNDGGYIVAGQTGMRQREDLGPSNPPMEEVWIVKLSSEGDVEWQKIFGEDNTDEVHFIQQTNDGGYIFGGRILISTHYRSSIIKLSSNGDVEWQKSYGGVSIDINSLQQTTDEGYVVAGELWSPEDSRYEFMVLKLFFDGTVEWSKTYGGTMYDQAESIRQTVDGGYIVAGQTESFGAGGYDIWILKLASDGRIEWQKTYGGSESEGANSIRQTNEGGYIVAGQTLSFGAGFLDIWILKISSVGDIEWQKTCGGSQSDVASSVQQTFDGGYVIAGETTSFGAGNKEFWILKLDILGDIEWQKTYGGSQNEEASFIQQAGDGGYLVAGSTDTYGAGKRDFLILKLFPNGDINSSCGFINDSNAEVFNPDISPSDTNIDFVYPDIQYIDIDITPRENETVVYSLCSGLHSLSITASPGGTTNPPPGTYIFDHAALVLIRTNPEEGYNFIGWSGDALDTDSSMYITMDSDKSIKANFSEDILEEIWEEVNKSPCFIATAAFGSPLHPYVRTLQDFRDKYLMSHRPGRMFVKLYYKYSPHIAELIADHKALRAVVRIWLVPFVAMGYSMVHLGPVKSGIMFAFTFMPLFFFVWFYRRRGKREICTFQRLGGDDKKNL